jgi:DNA modification methylase
MTLKFPEDFINKVICGDCLEILPLIPDGAVDAVITDPPYGIDLDTTNTKYKGGKKHDRIEGDSVPFNPKQLLRFYDKPMIIWGGNCFASKLPDQRGWLAWIKTVRNGTKIRQAEAEFAWTNCINRSQCFRTQYTGAFRDVGRDIPFVHPTTKPLELMRWCLDLVTKENDLILDPYCGSGSTLVAAKQLGRRYIGIEISEKYCRIAEDRLRQGELFGAVPAPPKKILVD